MHIQINLDTDNGELSVTDRAVLAALAYSPKVARAVTEGALVDVTRGIPDMTKDGIDDAVRASGADAFAAVTDAQENVRRAFEYSEKVRARQAAERGAADDSLMDTVEQTNNEFKVSSEIDPDETFTAAPEQDEQPDEEKPKRKRRTKAEMEAARAAEEAETEEPSGPAVLEDAEASDEQPEQPEEAETEEAEQPEEPEAEQPADGEPMTTQELVSFVTGLLQAGRRDDVKKALTELGVERATDMNDEQRLAFKKALS